MDSFDKIIGYQQIKQELAQIADTMAHRAVYKELGVSTPSGLLLHGVPGVGKTLMARCLIEASGLKAYVCRKTEPNGEFVGTIAKTFIEAVHNAPAIVYLDDMDKFANDDERHPNSEEFVTVQSCIDECKGKGIFVLATANDTRCLPRSLMRAGRFDRVIQIKTPEGDDAAKIVEHYLSNKKIAKDVDAREIADILEKESCATLETVVNEAGIIAGYQRNQKIEKSHMIEACLNTVFSKNLKDRPKVDVTCSDMYSQVIWHEAGHLVATEVLDSYRAVLAFANKEQGFVKRCKKKKFDLLRSQEEDVLIALAGKASVENRFGILDAGAASDLSRAHAILCSMSTDICLGGFSFAQGQPEFSDEQQARLETVTASFLEEYYRKAQHIIVSNRDFVEKVAFALADRGVLTTSDIAKIKSSCTVVPAAA